MCLKNKGGSYAPALAEWCARRPVWLRWQLTMKRKTSGMGRCCCQVSAIPYGNLEPDLVNPFFQHRDRKAFTVAFADRHLVMAEQCLSNVLRATGGAQPILRAVP